MSEYAVKVQDLSIAFQGKEVLRELNLDIKRGSICALLGPNGAGKTTLMKILAGLIHPDQGNVSLVGKPFHPSLLRRVGCLIEKPSLYNSKTANENLSIHQQLLGIPENAIRATLQQVGLSDLGSEKVKTFSAGMKQRLAIGMALMGSPDLLILDEPVTSLDARGMHDMRTLFKNLNRDSGVTILISSHLLDEISLLADCFSFLKNGKIHVYSKKELEEKSRRYAEIITDNNDRCVVVLDRLGFKEDSYRITEDGKIHLYENLHSLSQVNAAFVAEGIGVRGLTLTNKTLSDFYLEEMARESGFDE